MDKRTTPHDAIRELDVGPFLTVKSRLPMGGALQARRLSTGAVILYWRYTHAGKTMREVIGPYDSKAPPKMLERTERGFGLLAADKECERLGTLHSGRLDSGGYQAVKDERRTTEAAQKAEKQREQQGTLQKLLDAYVAYLKKEGRKSHREAENLFRLHVTEAWPDVAALPAAAVTLDQGTDILRRLFEQGKGRTANKVRSYLRAAYQCAFDVRGTPKIPVAFKVFDITVNPFALTKRDASQDRADKRPLKGDDMLTYWRILKAADGPRAAMLRLHLLTGGQRIEQFVRLKWEHVTDDAIIIHDIKGRPGQAPRPHTLPLLKQAAQALSALPREGEFAFSTTGGEKHISNTTLSGWAQEMVGEAIEGFQLKRVRSGVETLLQAADVSQDVRGHLQSHGLTGVQHKHYADHDFMPEKRRALETLLARLEAKPSRKVVPFPRNRAAR